MDRGSCAREGYGCLRNRLDPGRLYAAIGPVLGGAVRCEYTLEKENHMRYRLLGNSGLRVSEAALGAMTFGEDWGWGSAKDEARKVYDAFLEAGGNFIDTANFYTNGNSEAFLGEFMEGHRQSVVLATKYSLAVPGNDPNVAGNHRKNMMQAVEASLKRLQTDYIDLYWVHIWDGITPVEEV